MENPPNVDHICKERWWFSVATFSGGYSFSIYITTISQLYHGSCRKIGLEVLVFDFPIEWNMQVKKDGAMKKTIGSIFFLVHEYLPCALQINKMWEYVTINTWILWVRMYINIYLYTYIVHIHIYIYILFLHIYILLSHIYTVFPGCSC